MMYHISASGQKTLVPEPGPPEFVMMYGPWMIDADPPEEAFRISPPTDAKSAESFDLNELMFGAAYSLRGKSAPNIVAPMVDGRPLVLSRLKGRVVVVGFWNLRWPGGDSSLADLARIGQQYRGKGVEVYAVNLGDKPEVVRKESSRVSGQVRVVVDTTSNAGKVYGVKKLPHTVIIGKDGTVQFVQVFWSSTSQAGISAAIDALLSGKDLTKQDGPAAPASGPGQAPE
jgi:peroxiredoxin